MKNGGRSMHFCFECSVLNFFFCPLYTYLSLRLCCLYIPRLSVVRVATRLASLMQSSILSESANLHTKAPQMCSPPLPPLPPLLWFCAPSRLSCMITPDGKWDCVEVFRSAPERQQSWQRAQQRKRHIAASWNTQGDAEARLLLSKTTQQRQVYAASI